MYYWWDPTYILVLIGVILCMLASANVNSTYSKYARYSTHSGMTGAQVAQRLLQSQGIYDVKIEHVSGSLTDHYDPRSKVVRLSDVVYNSTSAAAIGVAAHECGHAMQHANGYLPLTIRGNLVPVVNIASSISWPLIIIGLFMGRGSILIQIGILLFCAVVLFQLITLPVEFNASARGLRLLENNGILYGEELKASTKVLRAAALTYVAGAASSILQLLRLLILFGNRDD